jgi:hypothetical protein
MLSETVHGRLLVTRNAQLTRRHAHQSGLVGCSGQIKTAGCVPPFLGLTCGLIRVGSGASAVGCGPRLRRDQTQPNGSEPPAAELESGLTDSRRHSNTIKHLARMAGPHIVSVGDVGAGR